MQGDGESLPLPEVLPSIPSPSMETIDLPLKNTMVFQNQQIAHFNPKNILDLFGLQLQISEPTLGSGINPKPINLLNFRVSYKMRGNLAQIRLDKPTKRQIAQPLGMSYEPLPYALVSLEPHMKVALNLTSKLGKTLKAYKRYLISLMSLVHNGANNNVSKPELGEEFTKALELGVIT